jgi:hypothetical protein
MEIESYIVTDGYFGRPYIDVDEHRDTPVPHRHVHGGFEDTDTRFRFYFPDDGYQGRMFDPLSGAHGGTEDFFGGPFGELIGGLGMCLRLGGYMVESNQGHIGDDVDARAGEDPGLYGWRATAEVARFSKHCAAQVYGSPPHHSYVFGGSGGGRRSPLCLEGAPDVFDGALPFMGGGDVAEPGNNIRIGGAQVMSFASMFNVQRLLGPKIDAVIDAMAPGGSCDPFAGLDTHRREELASLYRQGFPRGDEHMIAEPMGQIWLWTSIADLIDEQDPTYFPAFWSEPGYVGHDQPEYVTGDLIDATVTVDRVITATELMQDEAFSGPEFTRLRTIGALMAGASGGWELPVAVQLSGLEGGYRLGTQVRVVSGASAGRVLYCSQDAGDVLMCDGHGEANLKRFSGVEAGDQVHVDNHRFLAYCYFARHHAMPEPAFDSLRVDGRPVYPQHPAPLMSSMMGNAYSGSYTGKLLWVHHTHDSSLWPSQGIVYDGAVRAVRGAEAPAYFRIRWSEHSEHVPPMMIGPSMGRAANTWLIDYQPIIEQSLLDLVRWVEDDVAPTGTSYQYHDGRVTLPETAAERGGIQPVVSVTANGVACAYAGVGESVSLGVHAEVPPGAGTIVSVEWDFDGSGSFGFAHPEVDGTAAEVKLGTSHTYDRPGTYFVTALVRSHRDGDVSATTRRIPNLAQARVVVT